MRSTDFRSRKYGLMAEGLGTGLQNHLQRFESASDLKKMHYKIL